MSVEIDVKLLLNSYSKIEESLLINNNFKILDETKDINERLKVEIYINLLEEIFKKIELLSNLLDSFSEKTLEHFVKKMITSSGNAEKLNRIDKKSLLNVFKYIDLEQKSIDLDEKKFIEDLRNKNIDFTLEFIQLLKEFRDMYWKKYNKIKHSYTIIDELKSEGKNFIPIFYNSKDTKDLEYLIIDKEIYLWWMKIYRYVILSIKIFSKINYSFIKRGKRDFIYGSSFRPLSNKEYYHLQSIESRIDEGVEVVHIYNYEEDISKDEIIRIKELMEKFEVFINRI